ncbi:stage II sporulation protein M [Lentibacillus sp. CBA3610]|uniref:stage II sporulation protein M n=1 Tax=Lentibacillus sp. CBA3610 TaxID=2518176 RepID=UPI0015955F51|nr:stage II sporulation protein M [Lentibacillus sp. CBA3610]QKY69267.1 stage II sporulation protein M [Lentibacillus sp. CBA3610]
MNIRQFIKRNRDDWKQLEDYITKMRKNKRHLSGRDINQFSRLYQKAAQHLSYSQTYYPNEDVTPYLNELVARAHNLLYKDQVSSFRQVRTFFGTTFIGLLLEQWKAVIVAMLLFAAGLLAAFLSVLDDPLNLYSLLPEQVAQSVNPEQLDTNNGSIDASLMSASIMANNIRVAFLAFAGGITFGILTVYIMVLNGVMVGALAGLFWHYGYSYEFWAYIVPHGVIELVAIFIAGGAGLLMGYKLFAPGAFSRGFQLKRQAKRSVQLLLGTIPLFVIAGIIEGFITPASLSLEAKYAVAFLTMIGLILYIVSGKWLLQKNSTKATLHS